MMEDFLINVTETFSLNKNIESESKGQAKNKKLGKQGKKERH